VTCLVIPVDGFGEEDGQVQAVVVELARHDHGAFTDAVKNLDDAILLRFENAPLSDVVQYLQTARDIRIHVEADILDRHVTIIGDPVTLHDALKCVFDRLDCEIAMFSDGDILARPVPPLLLAVRRYSRSMAMTPPDMSWTKRSLRMTASGLVEQGGNLVWLSLTVRDDPSKDAAIRDSIGDILDDYRLGQLRRPSDTVPFAFNLTRQQREDVRRQRGTMFLQIMNQHKAETFSLLNELEATLVASGVKLPWKVVLNARECDVERHDGIALVKTGGPGRRWLTFKKLGERWLFDGSRHEDPQE